MALNYLQVIDKKDQNRSLYFGYYQLQMPMSSPIEMAAPQTRRKLNKLTL